MHFWGLNLPPTLIFSNPPLTSILQNIHLWRFESTRLMVGSMPFFLLFSLDTFTNPTSMITFLFCCSSAMTKWSTNLRLKVFFDKTNIFNSNSMALHWFCCAGLLALHFHPHLVYCLKAIFRICFSL